ncbi:MAG: Crp/Fnr family transcriptional regulator [Candidatus Acidiferrales bacterium]
MSKKSPLDNGILADLPGDVYERMLPDLEPVALEFGRTLYGANHKLNEVYFLVDSIVSKVYLSSEGKSAEIGLIGREGMVGIALFMSGENMPVDTIVQSSGSAYRMRARSFMQEFESDGALQHVLLRFTQAFIAQMGQTAVCNRHHTVEQQLCRWLLLNLDRLPGDHLIMTQDMIANLLGVRREGITRAVGVLTEAGLIEHGRGRVEVIDRDGLEARACECYAVVRQAYANLLPFRDHEPRLVEALVGSAAPLEVRVAI